MNVVDDDERAALVALSGLPGMGPARVRALVGTGAPSTAWRRLVADEIDLHPALRRACAPAKDLPALVRSWVDAARVTDPITVAARHTAANVEIVTPADPAWPFHLDPDPPAVLFAWGSLELLGGRSRVAIVGTRRCSTYGTSIANELGASLSGAGVTVVSGLAEGIDGAAHVGALGDGGTPPLGVVATGLDVVYPKGHRRLWYDVAAHGLLVTEMPLGTAPARWRFPARNRIIAAVADAVVVVESAATGGSMHTVEEALRRGVPVFAVPGPVTSRASEGTNRLLAEGAMPLCTVDDVLLELGIDASPPARAADAPPDGVAGRLLDALGWRPATLDQLVTWTGLPLGDAALAADQLERDGWVAADGGWLERRR